MVKEIIKRDGRIEPYEKSKVAGAIFEAAKSVGGTDYNEAYDLADNVQWLLNQKFGGTVPTVEDVQNAVEQTLINNGHVKTSKAFILYRAERNQKREMNTNLMKTMHELTFGYAKDMDIKRENANIDTDTPMGTMLKYGTEASKQYTHLYLLDKDVSKAHLSGGIHIHDLDFYGLTMTCATKDTKIVLRDKQGNVFNTTIDYFDKYFSTEEREVVYLDNGLEVLSTDGKFVAVKNCARRPLKSGEKVKNIKTSISELNLTNEHQVPVIRKGEKVLTNVADLSVGDELIRGCNTDWSLQNINLIDLFGCREDVVVVNKDYVKKYAKDKGVLTGLYNIMGDSDRKYTSALTLEHYCKARHFFKDLDESKILLNVKQGKGKGIPAVLTLTKELGKIMGYMLSEGSFTNKKTAYSGTFCNTDELLINDFDACMSSVFPEFPLQVRWDRVKNRRSGTICSRAMFRKLFEGALGYKYGSDSIGLPSWVFNANTEFLGGFIGALIGGDGCVDNAFYRITYTTVAEKFADDLHYLLLNLGVDCEKLKINSEGEYATFGSKTTTKNYDTYKVDIKGANCKDLCWVDSFKVSKSARDVKSKARKDNQIKEITVSDYTGFVYDIETGDNYFNANGYTIHNCVQIPLNKLFKSGFSTGHGHLRKPNSIRSYSALACIALQSSQNDMH